MIKRTMFAAAVLGLLAVPAMAEPDCSGKAAAKPFWEIVKSFEETEGGTVTVAKVTDEKCYEIYGRAGEKKLEIYYDPETGAILEREED